MTATRGDGRPHKFGWKSRGILKNTGKVAGKQIRRYQRALLTFSYVDFTKYSGGFTIDKNAITFIDLQILIKMSQFYILNSLQNNRKSNEAEDLSI